MDKRVAYLIVLVPVIGMALWLGWLCILVARAPEVVLRVEGYDPRDLLSGHYLTYRVQYGVEAVHNAPFQEDVCACFNEPLSVPASAWWMGPCSERPESTCPIFLKGYSAYGNRFIAGIERFYIPERYAAKLRTVPGLATIRVAVPANGRGIVRQMQVDGEDLLDWVRRRP
jgi:hypothetical protein